MDLVKAINQAETVRQTREGAGAQFILSSEAAQQRLAEQAMADAVALQQYRSVPMVRWAPPSTG
jgi:hypothetical protein